MTATPAHMYRVTWQMPGSVELTEELMFLGDGTGDTMLWLSDIPRTLERSWIKSMDLIR